MSWRCLIGLLAALAAALARPVAADPVADDLRQAICRTVDEAALSNHLPPTFLTRVLWHESRFQADATSRAGAEGVAQFMPKTAAERGLLDPRQISPAITHAARLLADLALRFGNLGLAAASYNAGAGRVAKWLHGDSTLPAETVNYVVAVTGRSPDDWARHPGSPTPADARRCAEIIAEVAASARTAPWAARLDRALAHAFAAASEPGPPARGGGASAGSTRDAEVLCDVIRSLGARCAVYQR